MSLIYAIDMVGTLVFAISGAVAAYQHRFDLFGAVTLAIVTSVGGGTIRDLMIGSTPVAWLTNLHYLYIIFFAILICYFFREQVTRWRKTFFLFDTVGIGLFTVLGVQKTLAAGLEPPIAIMMGVISAVFGGVVRDVLVNEQPLIFRGTLYATPCLAGGLMYMVLFYLNSPYAIQLIVPMTLVIILRTLSVKYRWTLPNLK